MLFKRKNKPHYLQSIKNFFWPDSGWSRSTKYVVIRVIRLNDTPHSVALGFAAGSMVSFTPFMGFHFILAALIAWMMRSNILASALGTFVGNPITFPFIWLSTYNLGNFLLMKQNATHQEIDFANLLLDKSWGVILPILKPMLLGGILIGIPISAIIYFIIKYVVTAFKNNKKRSKINQAS